MPKPVVIDTPFPSLSELARIYGISPTRRNQIARSVERMLVTGGAEWSRPATRRAHRKAAGRPRAKK